MQSYTVGLTIFFMMIQTAYASFGLCLVDNYYHKSNRNIVGFQLWNNLGDNGNHYRTVQTASKTNLENNNWRVHLIFQQVTNPWSYVEHIHVSHPDYGNIGEIPMEKMCEKVYSNHVYRAHYACYENSDQGYCSQERIEEQSTWCRTSFSLGTDSDTC